LFINKFSIPLYIIHADLKPENIQFLSKSTTNTALKLIDFGNATREFDTEKSRVICISPYVPPESLLEFDWSYPADIWSLGCILYELFTGKQLFPDFTRLTEQSVNINDEHFSMTEKTIQCAFYEHFSQTCNSNFCQGFSPLVLAKTRIGPRLKSSRPYSGNEKPVMITKEIFKIDRKISICAYTYFCLFFRNHQGQKRKQKK